MTFADPHSERSPLEIDLRAHALEGRLDAALTLALEAYGPEVLGYLHAVLPRAVDADEAFSELCERMWKGLPHFEWRSSFRTWMYVVARNVVRTGIRSRTRRARRELPLSDFSEVARMADRVRTSTAAFLKTESLDRLDRIRASLDPDEHTLLVLRIDRRLPWQEVARILCGDASLDGPELGRATARLRKRFERLKARVVEQLRPRPDAREPPA